jgi:hypothetical protein
MSKDHARRRALTGTFPGPSKTITVEPIRVPKAPALPRVPPEPLPEPEKKELPREPVPTS